MTTPSWRKAKNPEESREGEIMLFILTTSFWLNSPENEIDPERKHYLTYFLEILDFCILGMLEIPFNKIN